MQRPLRDKTQQLKETNTSFRRIRTGNPRNRGAADPRLRPRGHWDQQRRLYGNKIADMNSLVQNDSRTYFRVDFVDYEEKSDEELYVVEFLNRTSPSGLPPPRLNLNINVFVIFLI